MEDLIPMLQRLVDGYMVLTQSKEEAPKKKEEADWRSQSSRITGWDEKIDECARVTQVPEFQALMLKHGIDDPFTQQFCYVNQRNKRICTFVEAHIEAITVATRKLPGHEASSPMSAKEIVKLFKKYYSTPQARETPPPAPEQDGDGSFPASLYHPCDFSNLDGDNSQPLVFEGFDDAGTELAAWTETFIISGSASFNGPPSIHNPSISHDDPYSARQSASHNVPTMYDQNYAAGFYTHPIAPTSVRSRLPSRHRNNRRRSMSGTQSAFQPYPRQGTPSVTPLTYTHMTYATAPESMFMGQPPSSALSYQGLPPGPAGSQSHQNQSEVLSWGNDECLSGSNEGGYSTSGGYVSISIPQTPPGYSS